jgi:hypothetical protein
MTNIERMHPDASIITLVKDGIDLIPSSLVESSDKFVNFLDSLVTEENVTLIESIKDGYSVIKDSKYDRETYKGITDMDSVVALMEKLGKQDNKIRTVHISFMNDVIVNAHQSPSRIGRDAVGDAPDGYKGYWKNGKLLPFPERLINSYNNMGLTRG